MSINFILLTSGMFVIFDAPVYALMGLFEET
jgi:hypothetical protein